MTMILLATLLALTVTSTGVIVTAQDATETSDAANNRDDNEEINKDCLYRNMNPPESAHPVMDYYNPNNLDAIPEFLSSEKLKYPRIVEFYSPTCPHCQQFSSDYVLFGNHFRNLTTSTTSATRSTTGSTPPPPPTTTIRNHYETLSTLEFHAISCMAHKSVCQSENIRNYPTIKVIPANKSSKDAILLQAHELHPFRIAKILGANQLLYPIMNEERVEEEREVSSTIKGGKSARLRANTKKRKFGNNKPTTTTKTTKGKEGPVERLDLPKLKTDGVVSDIDNATLDNIPFPSRTQEEMYSDAYLSLYMTLQNNVFMEQGPLQNDKQDVLKSFLQLSIDTLPSWRILHGNGMNDGLLTKLVTDFPRIVMHERVWTKTIEKYKPTTSTDYSAACQAHGNGYTCGLWTLFHIITIGATEYNIANVVQHEELALYKMNTVAEKIKNFIITFFICDECTTHFEQEYNDCAFNRCTRLEPSSTTATTAASITSYADAVKEWSQLPLWLLDMHNSVNTRLQKKRMMMATTGSKRGPSTREQEQAVMWPPEQNCPACWEEINGASSRYNDTVLYKYMRLIYWPEDSNSHLIREEIRSLKSNAFIPEPTTLQLEKADGTASTQNNDMNGVLLSLIVFASVIMISSTKTNLRQRLQQLTGGSNKALVEHRE